MASYRGMIAEGYKEGALIVSEDFLSTEHIVEGDAVEWDATNKRWQLAQTAPESNKTIGMAIDGNYDSNGEAVIGSDVVASGKLPVLLGNAMVYIANFDNGAGAEYTPVNADVGKFVVASPTTKGRWELYAGGSMAAGYYYIGILRKIETINGVTMGLIDFCPKVYGA